MMFDLEMEQTSSKINSKQMKINKKQKSNDSLNEKLNVIYHFLFDIHQSGIYKSSKIVELMNVKHHRMKHNCWC